MLKEGKVVQTEKTKQNLIHTLLIVIGFSTLFVTIVGASFAYFSTVFNGSDSKEIKTGKLTINVSASTIEQENIIPTTWNSVISQNDVNDNIIKLPFVIDTSGTNIDATYKIKLTTTGLIPLETGEGTLADVKWALFNGTAIIEKGNFGPAGTNIIGEKTISPVDGILTNEPLISNLPVLKDLSGTGATENYILYIWIENVDTPQDALQNLNITATISASAETARP